MVKVDIIIILTLIIIMVKVDNIIIIILTLIIIMVKMDIIIILTLIIIMVKVDILILIIMVKVDNPNRAISNVDDYSDSSRLLAATILRFPF